METEILNNKIKVHCPQHQSVFEVERTPTIICKIVEHSLSGNFPNEKFWEYCCDCQIFSPSDLEVGGVAKSVCMHCERKTKSRFVCGECKIISYDSGEDTKGKIWSVDFDSKSIEPFCPGCSKSFKEQPLFLHKCEEAQTIILTSRQTCPFCKKETAPAHKKPKQTVESMINCPRCKQLNPSENPFCGNCGEKLGLNPSGIKRGTSEAKTQLLGSICPNCGNQNESGSIFCPACGQGLKVEKKIQPPILPPPTAAPNLEKTLELNAKNLPNNNPLIKNAPNNTKGCLAGMGVILAVIVLCSVSIGIINNNKKTSVFDNESSNSSSNLSDTSNTFESNSNPSNFAENIPKSESNLPTSFERTYYGTINGKSFTMNLKRDGNSLKGTASTTKTDSVYGEIDDDGHFTLRGYENDGNFQSGIYTGQIQSDGSITGNWSESVNSKKYYFSLKQN